MVGILLCRNSIGTVRCETLGVTGLPIFDPELGKLFRLSNDEGDLVGDLEFC